MRLIPETVATLIRPLNDSLCYSLDIRWAYSAGGVSSVSTFCEFFRHAVLSSISRSSDAYMCRVFVGVLLLSKIF